ncbi:MAG: hypothetical protein WKF81_00565 [Thermomicrobiales bacterium]
MTSARSSSAYLILLVIVALAIRLALAPFFGGFQYDMYALADWTWHLQFTPMNLFYEYASSPDHLPGDLWFLWGLGTIFRAFGGMNFESDSYQFAIKTVPALADAAIGILIYTIVASVRSKRDALLSASFYLFNPAVIYLTAVWGQWDSVSMALVLTALWIVVTKRMWLWSVPFLAWAVVIKPPLAPLAGLVVMIPIWRDYLAGHSLGSWLVRSAVRGIAAGVIGLVSVLIVILPYGVGLPGLKTTWQLLDRMQVAIDLYPHRTLAASNIWMLGQSSLARINDETDLMAGFSAQQYGNLLLVIAMAAVIVLLATLIIRRSAVPMLLTSLWMMTLAAFAFFMLPTRVHERYLFPALVCLAVITGLTGGHRRVMALATGTSLTYLLNIAIVYGGFRAAIPEWLGDFVYGSFLSVLAIANIAIFGALVWGMWSLVRSSASESWMAASTTLDQRELAGLDQTAQLTDLRSS